MSSEQQRGKGRVISGTSKNRKKKKEKEEKEEEANLCNREKEITSGFSAHTFCSNSWLLSNHF